MNTSALYAQRRARLAAQLGPGGLAVIPTAATQVRNRDSDHLYRHDSYFYYLTGFTEPHACLVLSAEGEAVLFCQPKDMAREIWDGIRLGPEAAPAALGVQKALPIEALDSTLPHMLENRRTLWFPFASHADLEHRVQSWLIPVRARVRQGVNCPDQLRDACALLDEMRLFKDAHELAIMRRAAQISAGAHKRAMQCAAAMLRAGLPLHEYHLDAQLLHEFRQHGAQAPAYASIVAGGANACILHYRADRAPIRDGDLVLIDAGCELDGYASDITRTFPANGRFSKAQRSLYEVVLAAQEAALAVTRPGARFTDPHDAAVAVLAQGMLDVGLLDAQQVGGVQDVIAQGLYQAFYMHRTGHWLGMDVHDCGSYLEPSADPQDATSPAQRPSRILRPGMVLTVEPGLYVRPAPQVPEAFWNMGIRIEDDVVVTAHGCEVISRDVPVSVAEIEALMRP